MPKIKYKDYNPRNDAAHVILKAHEVLVEYAAIGHSLTLRQLYYQFISRDLFPDSFADKNGIKNNVKSYQKLSQIISKAREAGYLDWDHITDRERPVISKPHWDDGEHFLKSVIPQFNLDRWEGQEQRCIVMVEKRSLIEVVGKACEPWDVPYIACKGYMSSSAMWQFGHNDVLKKWNEQEQKTIIIHLGDHDPSGIDMSNDIENRTELFCRQLNSAIMPAQFEVRRIALNMDQVKQYSLPPDPAKDTDPRFKDYAREFGDESWELDALDPPVIADLIDTAIGEVITDEDLYQSRVEQEEDMREAMLKLIER